MYKILPATMTLHTVGADDTLEIVHSMIIADANLQHAKMPKQVYEDFRMRVGVMLKHLEVKIYLQLNEAEQIQRGNDFVDAYIEGLDLANEEIAFAKETQAYNELMAQPRTYRTDGEEIEEYIAAQAVMNSKINRFISKASALAS